jgi:hypothetical protein
MHTYRLLSMHRLVGTAWQSLVRGKRKGKEERKKERRAFRALLLKKERK